MEGFDIAVAEALYAELAVIDWKLPIFEEICGSVNEKVKFIEPKL
jgi:hypothetical protein